MKIERLKRYKDKLDLIAKRKTNVEDWLPDFLEDEKTELACYKAFQEITEASMDLLAMIAKDEETIPKDDYSNIDFAVEKKIITKELGDSLKEANGLRNRVIHHYQGLQSQRAYESITELLPLFDEFDEKVKAWTQKK